MSHHGNKRDTNMTSSQIDIGRSRTWSEFMVRSARSLTMLTALAFVGTLVALVGASTALASDGWSAPIPIDQEGGSAWLTSVACPAVNQCTAVGQGQEVTFNPTSPGTPIPVSIDGSVELTSIACPSTSQCITVDAGGREITFNPTSPGTATPTVIDNSESAFDRWLLSIACPSSTQCTATSIVGQEVTFNPTNPGTPTLTTINSGETLGSVACPSANQCTATGSEGREVTFNPTNPGTPTPATIDSNEGLEGIACPSTSQCTVIDKEGDEVTFNPTNPGTPTPTMIDGGEVLTSITCPSTGQCIVVDQTGYAFVGSIGEFASPPSSSSPPTISGIATQGQTLTEQHGSWTNEPTGYAYQWEDCDTAGNNCTAIAAATGQSYTLAAADVGHAIRVQETASNAGGKSSPATSAATAVVQAPSSGGTGSEGGGGAGSGGGSAGGGGLATTATTSQLPPPLSAPAPAPVSGQSQAVSVVTGTVSVRLKGTTKFVPFSGASVLPDGSEVEATNGHVLITVATQDGHTQSAEVWGGRFLIHQEHTGSGETRFILSLPLTGCSRVALPHGTAAAVAARAKHSSGPKSRHLWVSESGGSWGTNGRYVSTSVEGTRWLTLDECTRSVVKVAAGKVKVHDLVSHRTKTITTGQHYTAKRR